MKPSNRPSRARPSTQSQRAKLLRAFDRSGLSAAAFARQHQLNYTTFCGWRRRRSQAVPSPAFVQVELSGPTATDGLIVELSANARLRIESPGQIALAAQLLHHLNAARPC